MSSGSALIACTAALLLCAPGAMAQTTGTVLGQVVDAATAAPLAGVGVHVEHLQLRTLSRADGRFALVGVPVGERALRLELLGYETVTVEGVHVRPGRAVDVRIELHAAPIAIEGVTVDATRQRLIEPEITVSREVLIGRELRELPVDALADAIELTPGVTGGHFRGGRVGQEVYVVDGVEVKNRLEASTQGSGLEFSPSSLEEVEVVTGGFGAQYGSALSGVVNLATRRGSPERWSGSGSLTTDHWAPEALLRGFGALNLSAGGPLPFLGDGATLFADVLAQSLLDADPRARGLTCVEPGDASAGLAAAILELSADPATAHLHCPWTSAMLPHQRGEKLIGFVRFDRPLGRSSAVTLSLLRNRLQRQLYSPEFKYNAEHRLGQRSDAMLGTVALDWTRHSAARAIHVNARASALRLERYLGALDPAAFDARFTVGGVGPGAYAFLGESFVRRPIEEQLLENRGVPGYLAPGGSVGSPFGPGAEGVFFTAGTPTLANWTRTASAGGDLTGEVVSPAGHALRAGTSVKAYSVESYERTRAHLASSAPNYVRFYPTVIATFAQVELAAADEVTVQLGVRAEAFRSGLVFRENRGDFLEPAIETSWKASVMPRIGVALPIPGTDRRSALRFSYGLVAQPPDFRYFLDTTIGDSLRTDIRRQGNPELSFERGSAYEVAVSHLIADNAAAGLTVFRKELSNLVAGNLEFAGAEPRFSTGDFGRVTGAELTLRARWRQASLRAGYALQRAYGVTSSPLEADTLPEGERIEFPLAFDRRHSIDVGLAGGRAAGIADARWSGSLTAAIASGFPLARIPVDTTAPPGEAEYMPWTAVLDLRVAREIPNVPGCRACTWRVVADARNVLGLDNVIAYRRDTGSLAPSLDALEAEAAVDADAFVAITRESPRYSLLADLDRDGVITADEYGRARFAALLDRHDPSLYFGEARQVRLGIEVTF